MTGPVTKPASSIPRIAPMRSDVPLVERDAINAYAGGMKQPVDIPPMARARTKTHNDEPVAKTRLATMASTVPRMSSDLA
ncbi:unannotated protein [freshwater metagenome]|uniref:Unannotated protein n=1 Tax=freshwater metagenome TaxID=449393 RepID=A0A6J6GKY2_9ZZZZ